MIDTAAVTEAIVEVCAETILPRFRRLDADEVRAKARPGDLVTIADAEAEAALTAFLAAGDPGALIVGEEATFARPELLRGLPDAERAWVVDPVDGTVNFAHGDARFGVMVAELRWGEVVRGWIWQPINARMFVAEKGAGVTMDGRPLQRLREPGRVVRGATLRRLRRQEVPGYALRHTVGSCAIDYPRLALGELDLLAYGHDKAWDHAAGTLMVTELGGRAAVADGRDWRPGVHGGVLLSAASPGLWERAERDLLRPLGPDALR